jgi:hypothetical protein
VIVEVEQIEPDFHVLARVIELGDAANISSFSTSLSGLRSEM